MLSWATSGARVCHHAGDIHVHFGERFDQREPTATTTYTLTATNAAGSVTSTQTVTVNTASIPTISSFTGQPHKY